MSGLNLTFFVCFLIRGDDSRRIYYLSYIGFMFEVGVASQIGVMSKVGVVSRSRRCVLIGVVCEACLVVYIDSTSKGRRGVFDLRGIYVWRGF